MPKTITDVQPYVKDYYGTRPIWQFIYRSVIDIDRPVNKLPFGTKCYELFVILYTID